MRAGELRHRLTIQQKTGGTDDWGSPLPDAWADMVKVWGNVRHLNGTESIRAGAITSIVNASIRIRHRTDVTPAMRVLHAGNRYDIQAVLPGGDGVHVDLLARMVA